LVDAQGRLRGLITVKDILKHQEYPFTSQDEHGRLRVAAAVGVAPTSKSASARWSGQASMPSSSIRPMGTRPVS